MAVQLTYYILEGLLVGVVDKKLIHVPALSGGGGGSTKAMGADSTNNPYRTYLKTAGVAGGHVHGGPIPPGRYTIDTPQQHPHLGLSARLTPAGAQPMYGRGGFFIHGRGSHGSDGCIVPIHPGQFSDLMKTLERSAKGVLHVCDAIEGSFA